MLTDWIDRPGLRPPSPEEAEARLLVFTASRLRPATARNYWPLWHRFCAFQSTCAGRPLLEQAQRWLATLPASGHVPAKAMLKAAYGRRAYDWESLAIGRYHRNEANLYAGVLRAEARARLRAVATTPRDRALVECLWSLRRAEVARLRWRDLRLPEGLVDVVQGKGGKSAWTILMPEAQAALARWFDAAGQPPDASPVFANRAGQAYVPETIGRMIQRLLQRAGLWTRGLGAAHRLRRSCALAYLQANPADLEGLRRLMRHEKIATTSMYLHLSYEDLAPRLARVQL